MSRNAEAAGVRHLSPADLEVMLRAASATPPLLVDVREVYEFSAGHLQGSVNIPLAQLPQRLTELGKIAAPVFICRSGGRSLAACQIALGARIASPANLEGGLLAWAAEIDPSLRVA
jgi:rhodanese-related sulfurtransferase